MAEMIPCPVGLPRPSGEPALGGQPIRQPAPFAPPAMAGGGEMSVGGPLNGNPVVARGDPFLNTEPARAGIGEAPTRLMSR